MTTSAVVTSLVLIVVADAIITVIYNAIELVMAIPHPSPADRAITSW